MISKQLAKLFAKANVFVKEHARQITLALAVIGLVCVALWVLTHFWTVIKVCLGILVLGIVCGGFIRR